MLFNLGEKEDCQCRNMEVATDHFHIFPRQSLFTITSRSRSTRTAKGASSTKESSSHWTFESLIVQ
jgi:hypothetical protein